MNNLVRLTSYYPEDLVATAKRLALDQKRSLYEVLSEALRHYIYSSPQTAKNDKPFKLEDYFGPPFKAGVKKKNLTRKDFYDLDKL